ALALRISGKLYMGRLALTGACRSRVAVRCACSTAIFVVELGKEAILPVAGPSLQGTDALSRTQGILIEFSAAPRSTRRDPPGRWPGSHGFAWRAPPSDRNP